MDEEQLSRDLAPDSYKTTKTLTPKSSSRVKVTEVAMHACGNTVVILASDKDKQAHQR